MNIELSTMISPSLTDSIKNAKDTCELCIKETDNVWFTYDIMVVAHLTNFYSNVYIILYYYL